MVEGRPRAAGFGVTGVTARTDPPAPAPDERTRIGVLRTYTTRHGPGPMVTADPSLVDKLPEPHNAGSGWQGAFRVGPLDCVATRYALAINGGVDVLALTHLDHLPRLPGLLCTAYRDEHPTVVPSETFIRRDGLITDICPRLRVDLDHQERLTHHLFGCQPIFEAVNASPDGFVGRIEQLLQTPVGLMSFGPRAGDKQLRAPFDGACAASRGRFATLTPCPRPCPPPPMSPPTTHPPPTRPRCSVPAAGST